MTRSVALLGVGVLVALLALAGSSRAAPLNTPADSKASAANLDGLWTDLASNEDGKVARALLGLSATPEQTMKLLKERLLPIKADEKTVNSLVEGLDSEEFATRERAFAHLEYLGKYAKEPLEKVLKGSPTPEVKRRIEQLLAKLPKQAEKGADPAAVLPAPGQPIRVQVQIINGKVVQRINGVDVNQPQQPMGPTGPPAPWVRAARAVALLEHLNTTESKQLLEAMAAGEADALPTKEAKAALARLNK